MIALDEIKQFLGEDNKLIDARNGLFELCKASEIHEMIIRIYPYHLDDEQEYFKPYGKDPNKDGIYIGKALNLVKSWNGDAHDGLGILVYLPDLKKIGQWDNSHNQLLVFQDDTWEDFQSNLKYHIDCQWETRHAKNILEVFEPSKIFTFIPSKLNFTEQEILSSNLSIDQLLQAQNHYNKGQELNTAQDYEKAIHYFDKAINIYDQYFDAYQRKALMLEYLKQYQKAVDVIHLALYKGGREDTFYCELGRNFRLMKKYNLAIETYQKVKDSKAFSELADCYKEQKKYEKAIEQYDKIIAKGGRFLGTTYINKGVTQHDYLNDMEGAFQSFKESQKYINGKTYLAFFYLGIIFQNKKKYSEAINWYEKALDKNKKDSALWSNIGQCYYINGDIDKAKVSLSKAIELGFIYQMPYNYLGIIYMEQKNYKKAEKVLKLGIEKDKKEKSYYYNLSCLFAIQKKPNKALNYIELAIQNGYSNFENIKNEKDFESIRNLERFKILIS